MPLKRSKGNMYPWVTHTHSHLGGECPHECFYCYVDNPIHGRPDRYKGPVRLIEAELNVRYGSGKVIFIDNMADLFAKGVPIEIIRAVIGHCRVWPDNLYVFQTKNPARYLELKELGIELPEKCILGCTVETNRDIDDISKAPTPRARCLAMLAVEGRKFITVEPILDLDPEEFSDWIVEIGPEFVNIGADSKGHRLPEPPAWKVEALIKGLMEDGVEIREKHNLERLLGRDPSASPSARSAGGRL